MTCNNLVITSFQGNRLSALIVDSAPWFAAPDTALCLGRTPGDAPALISRLRPYEHRLCGYPTPFGEQPVETISTGGILRLVLGLATPAARLFGIWLLDMAAVFERAVRLSPTAIEADLARFKAMVDMARHVHGVSRNPAILAVNQEHRKATSLDVLEDLGLTKLRAPDPDPALTVTDIGNRLGLSAKETNQRLAAAGLQKGIHLAKGKISWEATEAGAPYSVRFDVGKKHGSGAPVTQLRWLPTVVDVLQPGTCKPKPTD